MANLTTEQALQVPQQLHRQNTQSGGGQTQASSVKEAARTSSTQRALLSDDAVTLQRIHPAQQARTIDVNEYKSQLGSDSTLVRETLQHKLVEHRLSPHTPISVSKDVFGELELKGPVLQTELNKIKTELEATPGFVEAFNRVSQQQPTLNYVDNVVKISKAYGVNNNLFDTIVSEDSQFNGLNDIAHRYQAMRASTEVNEYEASSSMSSSQFSFVVN